MNQHFRNIKENKNLDYIEESDDEADFEDVREDRFVDLKKTLNMECIFNNKFKRWVPMKVITGHCKVVHISQLIRGGGGDAPTPVNPHQGNLGANAFRHGGRNPRTMNSK